MSPVVGPVGQSVRLSCPVQCCDVPGSPILEARSAFWARVGPAACDQHSFIGGSRGAPTGAAVGRTRDLVFVLRNACLPVYLADLTIMNGHGAHRRQEGSQLAAEPACSRRVRAPSKPWGDGCSRQVGEATTRRVTWPWGRPYGPSWGPLGLMPDTPCPPPLRLINSVERTSTRPSHGKVVA